MNMVQSWDIIDRKLTNLQHPSQYWAAFRYGVQVVWNCVRREGDYLILSIHRRGRGFCCGVALGIKLCACEAFLEILVTCSLHFIIINMY
jgi:hypothetical protein